jgi:hypothetical protein
LEPEIQQPNSNNPSFQQSLTIVAVAAVAQVDRAAASVGDIPLAHGMKMRINLNSFTSRSK